MKKLTSSDQLKVGVRLMVIANYEPDGYKAISVKKLIPMSNHHGDSSLPSAGPNDTEILLNKRKNIYFSMNKYLAGTSWIKEIYIVPGIDKRLKQLPVDMNGTVIEVGDEVELHGVIGKPDDNPIVGVVYSVAGMHGRPNEAMIWIKGKAAHHPKACIVRTK